MTSQLEPDRASRQAMVETVNNFINEWYDRMADMDTLGIDLGADQVEHLLRPPTEQPGDLNQLLADIDLAGQAGTLHPSGGHMAYIPNGGLFTGALGDFLATSLNRYTGVASAAPGFTAIEHGVISWMTSLFDLGPDSSGLLLSGGSTANFTGIVTARTVRLGDDLTSGVIYVSPHTHHSVAKAARLAGFRSDQVVEVAVDSDRRMSADALLTQVRHDRGAGRRPFMVVASAGTTDTGAVDALSDIAAASDAEDLWLHVDGAYGGFFQLTERGRHRLEGIAAADSIALDPHKGLSIPFGVGALLVRDEASLVDAHLGRGAYLKDEDNYQGIRDIASLGPELSRPFRGLSVWLPLHLHGVAPFRAALDNTLDLADHAYHRLSQIRGIDLPWKPDLSIVAFAFDDEGAGRAALEAVNADRTTHLSSTLIEGRFVLRIAILNRRTTIDHIDHAIDIIEKSLTA